MGWVVKGVVSTFLIFLLPTALARRHQINHHPRDKDLRFLMVPNVFETKTSMLADFGKDLNNIYTGYANVTGGFFPFLLKGSTYTDTIYGAFGNRSGMIIAGAALLGGTGYYFLNEINAVPSLEGMARMITRTSNDLVGAVGSYFKSIQTSILTSRSENVDTTHDRIDDIMYSLPGPPYNYDIKAVMNTTKWRFRGQHSETTSDRRGDGWDDRVDASSSASGVDESGSEEDFTSIDKHLGVPVQEVEWRPKPVRWPADKPNFIPLLRRNKKGNERVIAKEHKRKYKPKKYKPRQKFYSKKTKGSGPKKKQFHRGWHAGGREEKRRVWGGGGCISGRCLPTKRAKWESQREGWARAPGMWRGLARRQKKLS